MNQQESNKDEAPGQNKVFTIYVNTREKEWSEKEISYRDVVKLVYDNPLFDELHQYAVSYSKGDDKKPKGTLVDGGKGIHVKDGMVFDVEPSDRS